MKQIDKYLFFYGNKDHFSNFFQANFIINEITFSCGEQYIMYNKAIIFNDLDTANKIINESKPSKMKNLGRKVKNFNDKIWKENRELIAYDGLYAKYKQNNDLYDKILDTEDLEIIEASPTDTIWGIGMSITNPDIINKKLWRGSNILGKNLMNVRSQLLYESIS